MRHGIQDATAPHCEMRRMAILAVTREQIQINRSQRALGFMLHKDEFANASASSCHVIFTVSSITIIPTVYWSVAGVGVAYASMLRGKGASPQNPSPTAETLKGARIGLKTLSPRTT